MKVGADFVTLGIDDVVDLAQYYAYHDGSTKNTAKYDDYMRLYFRNDEPSDSEEEGQTIEPPKSETNEQEKEPSDPEMKSRTNEASDTEAETEDKIPPEIKSQTRRRSQWSRRWCE
jgi:hypothetical protein